MEQIKKFQTTIKEVLIVLEDAIGNDQKLGSAFVALKDFQRPLESMDNHDKLTCIDHVGRSADFLKTLYNLESWLFTCVFTEKNSKVFNGLLYLLTILVSWTDQSHVFRCTIVNDGQLFYHIKQLGTLEIKKSSEYFQVLAQYSIAIIANCTQELEFDTYIEIVKWGPILKPWTTLSKGDVTFHAKLLCGSVAPALFKEELSLLDIDMTEIIEPLGLASTSSSLKASTVKFSFSALELLEGLEHLLISDSNLLAVAKMDIMPTFISLLLNGNPPEKKITCRLLWILLNFRDFVFDEDMYSASLEELLLIMAEDPNDKSLDAYSKLLLADERIVKNGPTISISNFSLIFSKSVSVWLEIGSCLGLSPASQSIYQSLDHLSVSKHVVFSLWLGCMEKLNSFKSFFEIDSLESIESLLVKLQQHQVILDSVHLNVDSATSPEVFWSTAFISLCKHQTQKFLSVGAAEKEGCFPVVSHLWKQLDEFSSVFKKKALIGIVDNLSNVEDLLPTLYSLFSLLFVAEKSDLATKDMRVCLLHLVTILRDWSTLSRHFSVSLLNSGYLIYNCGQLLHWTYCNTSRFIVYMLNANLRILLNCCFEQQFEVYAKSFDWPSLLPRLHKSRTPGLQICSKILGACLAPSLSDVYKFLWELSDANTELMLTILTEAVGETEVKIEEFPFYSVDILRGLIKLVKCSKENLCSLMKKEIVTVVSHALSSESLQEKKNICLLVWELLSIPEARKALHDSLPLLTSLVADVKLSSHDSVDLKDLATCILYDLEMKEDTDPADCLFYCKVSHQYERYEECITFCTIAEKNSKLHNDKLNFKIWRAKSLFKVYKREQRYLRLKSLSKSEYYQLHKKCYEKTKEVIGILGMALDNDCLDSEGSKMFDLAMMDYIHGTNKLNDCKRCYLCRRKLINKLPDKEDKQQKQTSEREETKHQPVDGNETNTAAVSPGKCASRDKPAKDSKLVQSHPIPNSLLDRFTSSVPTPVNLKIFSSSAMGQQLEVGKGKVYAPKQISHYMFCRSCEDILSSKGETNFVRDFFGKIYDPENPQSPRQKQKIEYDSWLYHFCAGLIFRNLIWYDKTFINEDELYQLLLECREVVLNSGHVSSKFPNLYLLMTPLSVEEEELQYGSMNHVLSGGLQWYIGRHKLSEKSLEAEDAVLASFFLFHLGVVNVLFAFKPSKGCFLNPDFLIQVGGGTYFVPTEEERTSLVPPGMWAELQDDASLLQQEALEQTRPSAVKLDMLQAEERGSHSKEIEMFGIVDGAMKEKVAGITRGVQPNPSSHTLKRFNFLPEGLFVRPESSPQSLILPNNHSIILHHTFNHGNGVGETIFIVRNNAQAKLYLIWHNYIPGLQYSVAFKLNIDELSLGDVLTGDTPPHALQTPEFQEILDDAKKKISSSLPTVLMKKGVFKIESLIYRADMLGILPCVDRRCEKESSCWFCPARCDVCLDIAGFGSSMQLTKDLSINACSSNCAKFHPRTSRITQTKVIVATPGETPPPGYQDRCCPLRPSHKKLFHVYIEGISGDGLPYEGEIAVCHGDGTDGYPEQQPYGVYFSRSLQKQVLIEFFLSECFAPHSAVPFAVSDSMTVAVIAMLKEDGSVEQFIQLAHEEITRAGANPNNQ